MTNCDALEEAGGAVLSGDASPDERAAWGSHLAACSVCRAEFAAATSHLSRVRSARGSMPPPEGLLEEILDGTVRRGRVLSFPRRALRWAIPTVGIAAAATFALLSRPVVEGAPGREPFAREGAPVSTIARVAPSILSAPAGPTTPGVFSSESFRNVSHAEPLSSAEDPRPGISGALWAEAYAEAGAEDLVRAERAMGDALLDADALGTNDMIDGLSDEAAQSVLDDLKVEA